ncbi:hypothetical protein BC937DRAFT_87256 [Endogone sp. FLAS-F59071]|nr:hypothetical protein BC937DRAFT_87256 [Endogone sp. FLAS-F59071]|eukprot:RUS19579.1 hypothetical protein BC937DRAFT_87256 [Endogone sp. FLAS-F59071]
MSIVAMARPAPLTLCICNTPDSTIKADIVELRLGRCHLTRILLRGVAELENLLLTEIGVVVKGNLGIHALAKEKR